MVGTMKQTLTCSHALIDAVAADAAAHDAVPWCSSSTLPLAAAATYPPAWCDRNSQPVPVSTGSGPWQLH